MKRVAFPLLMICIFLAGCRELQTKYGENSDVAGYESVAGFGVMRQYFNKQGWKDRSVRRLSERYNSYDTIVWTNRAYEAPSPATSTWFEEWLQQGDRTLVYVIRDFQTVDAYWQQASQLAEPNQKLEYRRRKARSRMAKLRKLQDRPDPITNSWFTATSIIPPSPPGKLKGPWAQNTISLPAELEQEYALRAHDPKKDPAVHPEPFFAGIGRGVGLIDEYEPSETEYRSLLTTENGDDLVAELTSDAWSNSRVIVVAGGSYLTNFGLTKPGCQELLVQLEASCGAAAKSPDPKVGFLASETGSAPISTLDPSEMGPTGMEMLTEYPINLVTIHSLVCGLVMVLFLFPILGRPRWLMTRSSHDFDAHIDAVATLMSKTLGEQYARVRISEYMVRVRGEEGGEWVLPEPTHTEPKPQKDGAIKTATLPEGTSDNESAPKAMPPVKPTVGSDHATNQSATSHNELRQDETSADGTGGD